MPDWKFSEGGFLVKSGRKMDRCMKKFENHCIKSLPPQVHAKQQNANET